MVLWNEVAKEGSIKKMRRPSGLLRVYTLKLYETDIRPTGEEFINFLRNHGHSIEALSIATLVGKEVAQPISETELNAIASHCKHHELEIDTGRLDSKYVNCITPSTAKVTLYNITFSSADIPFFEACRRQRCAIQLQCYSATAEVASRIADALVGCQVNAFMASSEQLLRVCTAICTDLKTPEEASSFASKIAENNLELTQLQLTVRSQKEAVEFADRYVDIPMLKQFRLSALCSDVTDTHLDAMLSKMRHLSWLQLSLCRGLTSKAGTSLSKLPALTTLEIHHSIPLTEESCQSLLSACPQLQCLVWNDDLRSLTRAVVDLLSKLTSLTSLTVSASPITSDATILYALSKWALLPNIVKLRLPVLSEGFMPEIKGTLSTIPEVEHVALVTSYGGADRGLGLQFFRVGHGNPFSSLAMTHVQYN